MRQSDRQAVTVKARGFRGRTSGFRVRPLTFDQLQKLVLAARDSGWFGNPSLIGLVVNGGLEGDSRSQARASSDHVLHLNLAREIWLITLRDIASKARKTARIAECSVRVAPVRFYDFADLATPGMLILIADAARKVDIAGYMDAIVTACVSGITVKGRGLRPAARKRKTREMFDWLAPTLLDTLGLDSDLVRSLPAEALPTLPHRFFAALRLAETLDWSQYHKVTASFNTALEDLVFRSNQVGGSDAERRDATLVSCMPAFPVVALPPMTIPPDIGAQLFVDSLEGRLSGFSPAHRRIIKRASSAAWKEVSQKLHGQSAPATTSQAKLAAASGLALFLNATSRHPSLVKKACWMYFSQFQRFHERELEQRVAEMVTNASALSIPDLYLILEGPSDRVYYQRFLAILADDQRMSFAVEGREGKADVVWRVRDLLAENKSSGIVAILDADASQEKREIERFARAAPYVKVYIYSRGAIEDQFSAAAHASTLNTMYPESAPFPSEEITHPVDQSIKRLVYKKQLASFEKRLYAIGLAEQIAPAADIPSEPKGFVEAAIRLAEQRRLKVPRPASPLSIDRRSRQLLRRLAE